MKTIPPTVPFARLQPDRGVLPKEAHTQAPEIQSPTENFAFGLAAVDSQTAARAGWLATPHGLVTTPTFMPVGTRASVKGITAAQLLELGAEVVLANAYHLYLRPGTEVVAAAGGLHRFMGYERPLLTDSGGFQVFSLRDTFKLDADGVSFKSILDGSAHRWTPEENMRIQELLGADIIMQLDVCSPYTAKRDVIDVAVERSAAWARRCRVAHQNPSQGLFAIVQGGLLGDLRHKSVTLLLEAQNECGEFAGFGIGGYSVGEPLDLMLESLADVVPLLPRDRPRYLMGVGDPKSVLSAVGLGVDMFDSVLPTRSARFGSAFTHTGRLNLRNSRFARDFGPLDERCDCEVCQTYSRAYVHHLVISKEVSASVLLSTHNLHFLLELTRRARKAILAGGFQGFYNEWMLRFA
ncbi:MAG: tRNA guanosine(34) transglycosylase Tgt [Coriobacteriales bacterium]|nr:tRNA guanosine(34) transglycosylase Tgt [Coriobacteriales bacterium]